MQSNVNELQKYALKQLNERRPFHWPLEYPEIILQQGGFDALIGNPPFLWGQRISTRLGQDYFAVLRRVYPEIHGVSDLVAYFFLRGNSLINDGSCFGLISTDTIREGDTWESSLKVLCERGSDIYHAVSSQNWPGSSAVKISTVCVYRGSYKGVVNLDNSCVPKITSRLRAGKAGDIDSPPPETLKSPLVSYVGSSYGDGFLLTSTEVKEILTVDPACSSVIQPYLIGDDVLTDSNCRPSRHVINFRNMSEKEAQSHGPCYRRVKELVLPVRLGQERQTRKDKWWQYAEKATRLYETIKGLGLVLVHPYVSTHLCFAFVPSFYVYASPMVVICTSDESHFGLLQNGIHEAWIRTYCSTLGGGLRYTTSDGLSETAVLNQPKQFFREYQI